MSECKKIKLETLESTPCSASFCNNIYSKTMHSKPSTQYHPFPQDKMIAGQWKQFCYQNDPAHSFNFLCSDHFSPADYIIDEFGYKKLKSNALPTSIAESNHLKAEEIEIVHMIESQDTSEYDEYHVYELDDCISDNVGDQTNTSTISEKSNTEEPINVQNTDDADDEDAVENLDDTTIELLEEHSGIDDTGTPDYFESEATTDPRSKGKMLFEEARAALKLTASIKPSLPPKSTMEDSFGKRVSEQLKRIKNEKIYNDTVWYVQKALHNGIAKVKEKKSISCEVIDDIIVLDSPSEQNGDQESEDVLLEGASVESDVSDNRLENAKTQATSDKPVECFNRIASPTRIESSPQIVSDVPLQSQIRVAPLFTKEANSSLQIVSDVPQSQIRVAPLFTKEANSPQEQTLSAPAFSNSAVQASVRPITSLTEDCVQSTKPTTSSTVYFDKAPAFQKVILEPRESRTVISPASSISELLPQLQSNPNGTHSNSRAQNIFQKTDSTPVTTAGIPTPTILVPPTTGAPNITVPIILICPPALNQPIGVANSSIPNCNNSSNINNKEPNLNASAHTIPSGAPPQINTGNNQGFNANHPGSAVDILRAVSNLLAASIATPRQ